MAKQLFLRPLIKTIPTRIAVCIEEDAFDKLQLSYLGFVKYPWPEDKRATAMTMDLCGLVVVALPLNVKTSTLVHEAVHVFEAVMRDIGEDAPSEEFRAYSVQAIFEALQAEFLRLKKLLDAKAKA